MNLTKVLIIFSFIIVLSSCSNTSPGLSQSDAQELNRRLEQIEKYTEVRRCQKAKSKTRGFIRRITSLRPQFELQNWKGLKDASTHLQELIEKRCRKKSQPAPVLTTPPPSIPTPVQPTPPASQPVPDIKKKSKDPPVKEPVTPPEDPTTDPDPEPVPEEPVDPTPPTPPNTGLKKTKDKEAS